MVKGWSLVYWAIAMQMTHSHAFMDQALHSDTHAHLLDACHNNPNFTLGPYADCFEMADAMEECRAVNDHISIHDIKIDFHYRNINLETFLAIQLVDRLNNTCYFDGLLLGQFLGDQFLDDKTIQGKSPGRVSAQTAKIVLTTTSPRDPNEKSAIEVDVWPFFKYGKDLDLTARYLYPIRLKLAFTNNQSDSIFEGNTQFLEASRQSNDLPRGKAMINFADLIKSKTDKAECRALRVTNLDSYFTKLTTSASKSRQKEDLLLLNNKSSSAQCLIFANDLNSTKMEPLYLRVEFEVINQSETVNSDIRIFFSFYSASIAATNVISINNSSLNYLDFDLREYFEISGGHRGCTHLMFNASASSDVPPTDPLFKLLVHPGVSLGGYSIQVKLIERPQSFFLWAVSDSGQSAVTQAIVENIQTGRRLVSVCTGESLTPLYPSNINPEFRGFIKNLGRKQFFSASTFLTSLQTTMFTAPTDTTNCQISRFYISDTATTTEVTTAGDILTHVFWNANADAGHAITVDTTLATGNSKEILLNIQVVLGTGIDEFLNPQSYSFKIKIGCFNESQLQPFPLTAQQASNPYYQAKLSNTTNLHFEFPLATGLAQVQGDLQYAWTLATMSTCGAWRLTAYSDAAHTTLAASPSSSIYPLINPMYRDETLGKIPSVFNFDYDQTTTTFPAVFLHIEVQDTYFEWNSWFYKKYNFSMTAGFCSRHWGPKASPTVVNHVTVTVKTNNASDYFDRTVVNAACEDFINKMTFQAFSDDRVTPPAIISFGVAANGYTNLIIQSNVPVFGTFYARATNLIVGTPAGLSDDAVINININWNPNTCNPENRLPVYPSGQTQFEVIVQKNSGLQPFAFDFLTTYFTAPIHYACYITDWFLSTTTLTTAMVATDPEYTYFQSVTGLNTTKLQIKTEMSVYGYVQYSAKVWLKIGETTANKLNPTAAMIKFSIGCIVAPIVAEVSGQSNPYFESLTSTKATFTLPKPQGGTSTISINLNEVIEFKTNDTFCKVHQLTSFSVSGGIYSLTNSNSQSRLKINPVIRNLDVFEPVLEVVTDSSKTQITSIFFKAETEGIAGVKAGILQYYEFAFAYCSVGPILAKSELIFDLMVGEKQKEVVISDLYTIQQTSLVCRGVEYLLSSAETAYSQAEVAGVSLTTSSLQVNPIKVINSHTFYVLIRSLTSQIMVATKVQLMVKDCSSEIIEPVNPKLEFRVNELNQVVLMTTQQIGGLYSVPKDKRCSISDWQLTHLNSPEKITAGEYFEMFGLGSKVSGVDNLQFDSRKNLAKKAEVQVRLWVIIGSTAQAQRVVASPITIVVLQPIFAIRHPPVFKSPPDTIIVVTATIDINGHFKEDKMMTYVSPIIQDPFGLPIQIDIKWLQSAPDFTRFTLNKDFFELHINRTRITKSSSFHFSVQLGSEKYPSTEQSPTIFTIIAELKQQGQAGDTITNNSSLTDQANSSAQMLLNLTDENQFMKSNESQTEGRNGNLTSNLIKEVQTDQIENITTGQRNGDTGKQNTTSLVDVYVQRGGVTKLPIPYPGQEVVHKGQLQQILSFWRLKLELQNSKKIKLKQEMVKRALPLTLKPEFNRVGELILTSNQDMELPPIQDDSAAANNETRKLVQMKQINVTRDLFSIEFDFYAAEAEEKIEYSVLLRNWTVTQIVLKFSFTNSDLVSKGLRFDKVFIKVINPQLIRAASSGEPIDPSSHFLVGIVPTQLPLGTDIKQLEEATESSSNSLLAVMIVQTILQFIMKKSLEHILNFFIILQLMTYVIYFNIRISSPVEVFLLEMQKLVEFQNLNVNSFVKMWEPEFEVTDWIRGHRERLVNEDQRDSFAEKIQIGVIVACSFVALLIVLWIGSKKFEKAKKWLKSTIKSTFWNGLILSFQMQCMVFCIIIGNQVKLAATNSPYAKESERDAAFGILGVLNAIAVFMTLFLIWKKDSLREKEFQKRYGYLYVLPAKLQNILPLLRLPFSVWHRQLYMILAGAFYNRPYFSLQTFAFINLLFTMYRIKYKLDASLLQRFLVHFSDVGFHNMILLLFLFTDFVTLTETQLLYSFVFIGLFGLICLVNIVFIFYHCAKAMIQKRKKKLYLRRMAEQSLIMQQQQSILDSIIARQANINQKKNNKRQKSGNEDQKLTRKNRKQKAKQTSNRAECKQQIVSINPFIESESPVNTDDALLKELNKGINKRFFEDTASNIKLVKIRIQEV